MLLLDEPPEFVTLKALAGKVAHHLVVQLGAALANAHEEREHRLSTRVEPGRPAGSMRAS